MEDRVYIYDEFVDKTSLKFFYFPSFFEIKPLHE